MGCFGRCSSSSSVSGRRLLGAGGCFIAHGLQHFFRHLRDHFGGDEAWRHGVYCDPFRAEFAGPGFGHADQACLGGGVIGLAKISKEANDRRRIDDFAVSAFDHVRGNLPRAVENARQIDADDLIPLLRSHLY